MPFQVGEGVRLDIFNEKLPTLILMFENGNSFISDILGGPSFKLARPVSNRLRTKTKNRLSRQKRPPSSPRIWISGVHVKHLLGSKFAVTLQTFVPALQLNSSQMSSSPRQSTRKSPSQKYRVQPRGGPQVW